MSCFARFAASFSAANCYSRFDCFRRSHGTAQLRAGETVAPAGDVFFSLSSQLMHGVNRLLLARYVTYYVQ
jgi:hypothetical protein